MSCTHTGSRDRNGRAVVEIHGDRKEWMSPFVSAQSVCELLLYLHSMPRYKELVIQMSLNQFRVHFEQHKNSQVKTAGGCTWTNI